MKHTPEARRLLRELDAELAVVSERSGRSLVWTPQDRALMELIADTVDRRADLVGEYSETDDTTGRVRLSAEIRLLDGSLARLLKQVKIDVPKQESLTTVQARRAALARWHPNATG